MKAKLGPGQTGSGCNRSKEILPMELIFPRKYEVDGDRNYVSFWANVDGQSICLRVTLEAMIRRHLGAKSPKDLEGVFVANRELFEHEAKSLIEPGKASPESVAWIR
jgi:hypothetical protein